MRSILLYFGSFNPIHVGHVGLAEWVLENRTDIEELWLVVSPQNPFKQDKFLYPDADRLEWARRAVKNNPKIKVCDIEMSLPKPSYTITTLDALKAKYPDYHFKILIGGDNLPTFNKWKDYERILSEYGVMVYPREGSDLSENNLPNVEILHGAPLFPISSTQIREKIAAGAKIEDFLL